MLNQSINQSINHALFSHNTYVIDDRQTDGHNTVALARPSVRSAENIQEP